MVLIEHLLCVHAVSLNAPGRLGRAGVSLFLPACGGLRPVRVARSALRADFSERALMLLSCRHGCPAGPWVEVTGL